MTRAMSTPQRILFVQAYDEEAPDTFLSAPLGIYRLALHIEASADYPVRCDVFDPNLDHPQGLESARRAFATRVQGRGYDIIAFSPLHLTLESDLKSMYDAQASSPESLLVVGGQHASFAFRDIFSRCRHIDVAIVGEGEKPMLSLADSVRRHGARRLRGDASALLGIPGLRLPAHPDHLPPNPAMSAEEFEVATNRLDFGPRMRTAAYWRWIEDRFSPQALQDTRLLRRIRVVKPYTTNFCPMQCSFCSTTQFYRDSGDTLARVRGLRGGALGAYVERVLDSCPDARAVYFKDDLWFLRGARHAPANESDLRGLHCLGARIVGRTTPTMKKSIGVLQDLAELRRVRRLPRFRARRIRFFAKARVDTFVDPKSLDVDWNLVGATRAAGFEQISLGLESFDAAELDYFNKKLGPRGPEVNRRCLRACRRAGLHVVGYVILSGGESTVDRILTTTREVVDCLIAGDTIKVNPWLYSLPGATITAREMEHIASSSPPGSLEITPRDRPARELMEDFARAYRASREGHGFAEQSAPAMLQLLVRCAAARGERPIHTESAKYIDMEALERDLDALCERGTVACRDTYA